MRNMAIVNELRDLQTRAQVKYTAQDLENVRAQLKQCADKDLIRLRQKEDDIKAYLLRSRIGRP